MSFPLPHNMNPEDIRYMHVDAVIQGKDRNRIKYLDLEGEFKIFLKSYRVYKKLRIWGFFPVFLTRKTLP